MTKTALLLSTVGLVLSAALAAQVLGDPKQLVVQPEDLPGSFAVNGGDYQPDGSYVAMYMRPEVLAAPDLPEGGLLGVLANLELAADAGAARAAFADGSDLASVRQTLEGSGRLGSDVRQLEAGLEAADEAVLFRVEYTLQGVRVVEYRYRLRLDNAVASLMVSGRAASGGGEPMELSAQAREVAELQVVRLAGARAGGESG